MTTVLVCAAAGLALWQPGGDRLGQSAAGGRWWVIPAAAAGVLGWSYSPALVVAVGIVSPAVAGALRGLIQHRRQGVVQEELARALRLVHANVKAGALMDEAMRAAAAQITHPELVQRLRQGAEASWQEVPGAGAHTVALAAEAAGRYGISIEGLLRHAMAAEEHDRAHREATAADLQGAVTSAVMLAALPLGGILLAQLMGVDAAQFLLHNPGGAIALILGSLLEAAGITWCFRIIRAVAL